MNKNGRAVDERARVAHPFIHAPSEIAVVQRAEVRQQLLLEGDGFARR